MSGECRSSHFVVVVFNICLFIIFYSAGSSLLQSFSSCGEKGVDFLPMAFAKYVPF